MHKCDITVSNNCQTADKFATFFEDFQVQTFTYSEQMDYNNYVGKPTYLIEDNIYTLYPGTMNGNIL